MGRSGLATPVAETAPGRVYGARSAIRPAKHGASRRSLSARVRCKGQVFIQRGRLTVAWRAPTFRVHWISYPISLTPLRRGFLLPEKPFLHGASRCGARTARTAVWASG
jgi:hypothetical protein